MHVGLDVWMRYVVPPPDWRDWLGGMAFLNFLGLLAYRYTRELFTRKTLDAGRLDWIWNVKQPRFTCVLLLFLPISCALQIWVYARHGGIFSYIQSVESNENPFDGMGWIFVISESFPILLLIGLAVGVKFRRCMESRVVSLLFLSSFFVMQMLFGGLRGSRSNTVWGLFWATGIIHFWIRPVSRKIAISGVLFLIAFLYLYGFFKSNGLEGVMAIQSEGDRTEMEERSGRTLTATLLGDLGRSDVQAYLLYTVLRRDGDYSIALGQTYLAAVALVIPKSLRPELSDKILKGTQALFGAGSYEAGRWQASNVYGLAGEAMLNFGPIAVPFAFITLGCVVGVSRQWMLSWDSSDARRLLLPFFILMIITILASDLDNIVFNLIKTGLLPMLLITIGCERTQRYGSHENNVSPSSAS